MKRWLSLVVLAVALAGCNESGPDATAGEEGVKTGDSFECDYELDDYAGGQPRLMVHWDVPGYGREMSGIEFDVDVVLATDAGLSGKTTTDCLLFVMGDLDADVVDVGADLPGGCRYDGWAYTDHKRGEFATTQVELTKSCP